MFDVLCVLCMLLLLYCDCVWCVFELCVDYEFVELDIGMFFLIVVMEEGGWFD